MFKRTCLLADEFIFFDMIGLLPNRYMRQDRHVAVAEWAALIIFAALDLDYSAAAADQCGELPLGRDHA
jgi:hypothetical protein